MSDQLARLNRRLAAIPVAVREAVKPALETSANEMAEAMKALAPEDTGALRDSITVTPGGQTTPAYSQPGGSLPVPDNAVAITVGNTDVRYPHLQEYGTENASPQPFFWPSFRLYRKRAQRRISRSIGKAVREGWAK